MERARAANVHQLEMSPTEFEKHAGAPRTAPVPARQPCLARICGDPGLPPCVLGTLRGNLDARWPQLSQQCCSCPGEAVILLGTLRSLSAALCANGSAIRAASWQLRTLRRPASASAPSILMIGCRRGRV